VLRTPDDRFRNLAGYPFAPRYTDVEGARMHYAEQGRGQVVLCLHGEATWSYLYRKTIAELSWKYRVIAPDLIGFGRSDKYQDARAYSLLRHVEQLKSFIQRLDLGEVTLVCQDLCAIIGANLLAEGSGRFFRFVLLNPRLSSETGGSAFDAPDPAVGDLLAAACAGMESEVRAGYDAPFPDARFKGGLRSFPDATRLTPDSRELRRAREALVAWFKPTLVVFSDGDAAARGEEKVFRSLLPLHGEPLVIAGAGRFLPEEKGEEIADRIHSFIQRNPPRRPTKTFQPVPFW
jgi:haloalkane dehalogenase